MVILGIESSCDETAAAVVEDGNKILSNIVATSLEIHAKTGGIIPEQAARQQILSIIPVIDEALKTAEKTKDEIDAIAVTYGPGLIGSLLVGVEAAKTLSIVWNKPIIPVNHLIAHIYANWLDKESLPEFPALALVVSGGHTDMVLFKDHGKIKWIGGTRDDASGEAFDKTARLLGLPYPGGPSISKEAEIYLNNNPDIRLRLFPRPLSDTEKIEWSFSGLKTAVLREIQQHPEEMKDHLFIQKMAAEVQEAIIDSLIDKTLIAVNQIKPESFLLAGGVAANKRLREKFQLALDRLTEPPDFFVPAPKLCTDNAAPIAAAAYYNYSPLSPQEIIADPQLTITGEI